MPLRIIAAILLLVCSFSSISGASALSLNESRELLDRGKSYFFTDPMCPDSAAICFRQVANPTSGIYVIRYSDGTAAKVLLK